MLTAWRKLRHTCGRRAGSGPPQLQEPVPFKKKSWHAPRPCLHSTAGFWASPTARGTTHGQHACTALHAAATHRPHPACGTRASWEWLWQARRLGAPTRRPRARPHSAGPARPWLCSHGKRVSRLASLSKCSAKSGQKSSRRAPATARAAATKQAAPVASPASGQVKSKLLGQLLR